jgi:glycerate kinase
VKILVISDKFKGTLPATAAAEAIARGWLKVRPHDSIESVPMSDGGDGFGETIGTLLGAKIKTVNTVDAAHRRCTARWWWEPKSKTAIIESANVIGLAELPSGKFHPFELDTFGLGAAIRAAIGERARRCIVGIGGSATNDGGIGLARSLGWKFRDRDGLPIERWTELHKLSHISAPTCTRWFKELVVAVDVQNPLLGKRGATRVYGPQKGLRQQDLAVAEKNLRKLAEIFNRLKRGFHNRPGAGAAGGLGFGLMAFVGARAEPGFDLFGRFAKLDKHLRAADLVITGEGRIDASSFMGKGVGEIGRRCRKWKIPCIAVAGEIAARASVDGVFTEARALTELTTLKEAKRNPERWLECLAARVAQMYFQGLNSE